MSAIDPEMVRRAAEAVPDAGGADGPVFREPWEAEAFALTLALHERGVFSWSEWTAALSEQIRRAQAAGTPDRGETYYRHWLAALEWMLVQKGATDAATLARYRDAWADAGKHTPHGAPIELHSEGSENPTEHPGWRRHFV